ncbi:SH3 domain-containing protein [Actinomadura roseirufa]|uniref:SH3 domain-containing protein n=1 Tax=Actinomadura roseirufa TaxID=2094049 RepID=UPI0010414A5E|nr:SH3 domain-containing protein [Actinomadura roseirufa]
MHVGVKVSASLLAAVAGTALSLGPVAGAAEPPPSTDQTQQNAPDPRPQDEEGHGPGAIEVEGADAARALDRLNDQGKLRVRLCHGVVLPSDGLNVRSGPGTGFRIVGVLPHNARVTTDWDTIQRRNGYLWVRLENSGNWIADYKVGNGNGKWYVGYSDC